MKINKNLSYLLLLSCVLFLFSNCSIQKRTYKKGYFVQWNFKGTSTGSVSLKSKNSESFSTDLVSDNLKDSVSDISTSLVPDNSSSSVYKSDETDFIELEKNNSVSSNKSVKEIKAKSNPKTYAVKKHKSSDEIEKEKKVKDYGTRIHIVLTSALFLAVLGLVFFIRGISTNYINIAFGVGFLLSFVGIILLIISFLMFVNWLVKRQKNKEKSIATIRKQYRIFGLIDLGLLLSYGAIAYLATFLL